MEPIEPPWQAIKEWIADDEPDLNWFNQESKFLAADKAYDKEGLKLALMQCHSGQTEGKGLEPN